MPPSFVVDEKENKGKTRRSGIINNKSYSPPSWRQETEVTPKKQTSYGISPQSFHRRRSRPGQAKVERIRAESTEALVRFSTQKVGQRQELRRIAFKQITELRTWPLQAHAFRHWGAMMREFLQEEEGQHQESWQQQEQQTNEIKEKIPSTPTPTLSQFAREEEWEDSMVSSSSVVSVELEPKRIMRDVHASPDQSRLKVQYRDAFLAERARSNHVSPTTIREWNPSLWSMEPRIFSSETSRTGKRKYIVGNAGRFLDLYWRKTNPGQRHYYELIPEHSPCRLYLDLEFSKKANPTITEEIAEQLLDELFAELAVELVTEYNANNCDDGFPGIPIQLERSHIVDLDSSTETKFSRHWIVHLPGHWLFAHAIAAGHFVRQFVNRLATAQATGQLQKLRPCLHQFLLVQSESSAAAKLSTPATTCFIDLGVYTRNRLFRLMGSSKFGKSIDAILRIADANQFPFPEGFGNPCLYDTLKPANTASPPNNTNSSSSSDVATKENDPEHVHDDELESTVKKLIAKMDWTAHAEALAQTFVVPVNGSKIAFPILPYTEPEPTTFSQTTTSLRSSTFLPTSSVSVGPSPFPALDQFVLTTLANRGGSQGSIRAWSISNTNPDSTNTVTSQTVTYHMSRNRYCECVGRQHKSNNIYWTICLSQYHATQGCHDPECRLMNFRGTPVDLPVDVVEAIREVLFEQQLALLDDQALLRPAAGNASDSAPSTTQVDHAFDSDIDESFEQALLALDIRDTDDPDVSNGILTPICTSGRSLNDEASGAVPQDGHSSSDSSSSSFRSALLAIAKKKKEQVQSNSSS